MHPTRIERCILIRAVFTWSRGRIVRCGSRPSRTSPRDRITYVLRREHERPSIRGKLSPRDAPVTITAIIIASGDGRRGEGTAVLCRRATNRRPIYDDVPSSRSRRPSVASYTAEAYGSRLLLRRTRTSGFCAEWQSARVNRRRDSRRLAAGRRLSWRRGSAGSKVFDLGGVFLNFLSARRAIRFDRLCLSFLQ